MGILKKIFLFAPVLLLGLFPASVAATEDTPKWNLSTRVFQQEGDQDAINNVEGYEYDSRGIIAGISRKLTDTVSLTINLGYVKTEVEGDTGDKTEIDNQSAGAYLSFVFDHLYFVTGFSYSMGDIDVLRNSDNIKGDTSSDSYSFYNQIGSHIDVTENFTLTPFLTVFATYNSINGYTEIGFGAKEVDDDDNWFLNTSLGFKYKYSFIPKKLSLTAKTAWWHEYSENMQVTTKIRDNDADSFKISSGVNAGQDRGICGVELRYNITDSFLLKANYDYTFGEKFSSHAGIIGLSIYF